MKLFKERVGNFDVTYSSYFSHRKMTEWRFWIRKQRRTKMWGDMFLCLSTARNAVRDMVAQHTQRVDR